MPSPLVDASHDLNDDTVPTEAGTQVQYAQGGNATYPAAQPSAGAEPQPADSAQTLVMLQLASFEGRAM